MAVHERGEASRLFIYPLKSAAAIETTSLYVTTGGVAVNTGTHMLRDREFMMVWAAPDANGVHKFLTQRGSVREGSERAEDRGQTLSKLARIKPRVENGILTLRVQGFDSLDIPLDLTEGELLPVEIHKKRFGKATRIDRIADEWASDFVGANVFFMRAVDGVFERPVRQDYLRNRTQIRFQDGFQIHMIPEEAVIDLRTRMLRLVRQSGGRLDVSDVPDLNDLISSFRPNVVSRGLTTEGVYQIWQANLGEVKCAHPKPCDRCTMPKVNQKDGSINAIDPVKVLGDYMNWRDMYGSPAVIFGINLLPRAEGVVKVGDPIEITHLRRGSNRIVYGEKTAAKSASHSESEVIDRR